LHATIVQGDAKEPSAWWDGVLFDRILLDAPCSAVGVIRRHPDIKYLRTQEEVEKAALLQANLLQALWPLLAPSGMLLYATCSVLPIENDEQIAKFISSNADVALQPFSLPLGNQTPYGWQLLPQEENDGFFYALLRKI
jgi:16S rRNA (cytosine967-C5)-methyltransferase